MASDVEIVCEKMFLQVSEGDLGCFMFLPFAFMDKVHDPHSVFVQICDDKGFSGYSHHLPKTAERIFSMMEKIHRDHIVKTP